MFFHNALHYICRFLSSVGLPLLLLATIGVFVGSTYDLAVIHLTEVSHFVRYLDPPTLIRFANPMHVFIGSGVLMFVLIIVPDVDFE